MWGVSLTHPVLASILSGEFLLHIPCWLVLFSCREFLVHVQVLDLILFGEVLLNIPCWLQFYVGSFSYTSHVDFVFMSGVSLTHPVLSVFLCKEFILHIACWLRFFLLGSFSYTSRSGLFSLLREILLHIPCWLPFYPKSFSYTSQAGLISVWGVSFTHPVLALI